MYEAGTILELKEPRENDAETGEVFPYNTVKVVGPSPVDHATGQSSGFEGASAAGVIITPESNFGSTLDEPLGKLQALYDVVSVPVTEIEQPKIRVINSTSQSAGPTPEEVFKEVAPGDPSAPRRPGAIARAESPLEDPREPVSASPLDAKPKPKAAPKPRPVKDAPQA